MNEAALVDMQLAEWISSARTVFVLIGVFGISGLITYCFFKDRSD